MLEIFAGWKLWQIILTAVSGVVWIVFIVLDCRRKSKLKKLRKERAQELKACGYSDEQIKKILSSPKGLSKNPNDIYLFCGEQGSGKSLHFVSPDLKDGEK